MNLAHHLRKNGMRLLRSLVAVAAVAAGTTVGIELLCGLFYTYDAGQFFWTRARASVNERPPEPPRQSSPLSALNRLSPYYGYMFRPGFTINGGPTPPAEFFRSIGYATPPDYAGWPFNNYGFISEHDYPIRTGPQDFVVGIFGGSVAFWLAMDGAQAIRDGIASTPAGAGKTVSILSFAAGGYKQPQTSLILNYFLTAGQHFDLIINLDGFNESFVSSENVDAGIDPLMPRVSSVRSVENSLISPEVGYRVVSARYERAELDWRMAATRSAARYYWFLFMRDRAKARETEQERLAGEAAKEREYAVRLQTDTASYEDRLPSIVNAWVAGSLAMDAMAKRFGAIYLHILQPNQYFGARPFLEGQRGPLAQEAASMPTERIRGTYKALIAAGAKLREQGVDFIDATGVFDGHNEPIYYDSCCHFNVRGYAIFVSVVLAPAMQRAITARVDN